MFQSRERRKKSALPVIKWPRNPMINAMATLQQRCGNVRPTSPQLSLQTLPKQRDVNDDVVKRHNVAVPAGYKLKNTRLEFDHVSNVVW